MDNYQYALDPKHISRLTNHSKGTRDQGRITAGVQSRREQLYLRNFTGLSQSEYLQDILDRAPGACSWLFEHETYLLWLQTSQKRILTITAGPGCGKTTTSAHIIHHLRGISWDRPKHGHLTLYCFVRPENDDITHTCFGILRSLICQLLLYKSADVYKQVNWMRRTLTDRCWSLWGKNSEFNWSWEHLTSAFEYLLDQILQEVPCFIILDALDECDSESQEQLSDWLDGWLHRIPESKPLKIAVLSEQVFGMLEDHSSHKNLHIGELNTRHDMISLIRCRLAAPHHICRLRLGILSEFVQLIASNAQGRFTWAVALLAALEWSLSFHSESDDPVKKSTTTISPRDGVYTDHPTNNHLIEKTLKAGTGSSPLSLEALYTVILEGLNKRPDGMRWDTYCLVLNACEELSVSHLEALLNHARHDQEDWEFMEAMRDIEGQVLALCGAFLFRTNTTIRFTHLTARTFLYRQAQSQFGEHLDLHTAASHDAMACCCFRYLTCYGLISNVGRELQAAMKGVGRDRWTPLVTMLDTRPFLRYALSYSLIHLRKCSQPSANLRESVRDLVRSEHTVSGFIWSHRFVTTGSQEFADEGQLTALYFAAGFGIAWLMQELIDQHSPDMDSRHDLLIMAIRGGDLDTVRVIVEGGVDLKGYGGTGALAEAARYNQLEVAKFLIQRGVCPHDRDLEGMTAVKRAERTGHDEMAVFLTNAAEPS